MAVVVDGEPPEPAGVDGIQQEEEEEEDVEEEEEEEEVVDENEGEAATTAGERGGCSVTRLLTTADPVAAVGCC